MKKIPALIALSLIAISCKKEKEIIPQPAPNNSSYSYITTAGSYWVYDRYQVDSLGNEVLQPDKDTVRLVGDTIIGSYTYHKFEIEQWLENDYVSFQRDSSGFIVNNYGNILYSFNNVNMLLHTYDDGPYRISYSIDLNENVSTNYGIKNACVRYKEVTQIDGTAINNCDDLSARFNEYYVSGIGVVQTEIEYLNSMVGNCSKKRSKLSSYYIAP